MINWIKSCISKQLTIYLCAIALCVAGLCCLFIIPLSPFPLSSSGQSLSIHFSYPGANADTVQTQVTHKVVNALQAITNIDKISANSQNGSADISVHIDTTNKLEQLQVGSDILQAINSSKLPSIVAQPQISESGGRAGLLTYSVTSNKLSIFQIDNFIHSKLLPNFQAISGVSTYTSDPNPTVHIFLSPQKLAQYKLNALDIGQQLNNAYQSSPIGNMFLNQQSYPLTLSDPIQSLQQFKQLVIGYQGVDQTPPTVGSPIYLSDVANIEYSPRDLVPLYYSSYNGRIGDAVALFTTSTANPFQVEATTSNYIKQISNSLPADLKVIATNNVVPIMMASFNEVAITILISSILVLLIALIFLGRLKTTIIPIITIPICLLGATVIITALGLTLNILTLLAMVIAVGLVVDDAIVVVENITRHLEMGMERSEAIMHGTTDIALTVVGITITLLAVYLPICFLSSGFAFFLQAFAIPLAAAVFISGIVALTLTPLMCQRLITTNTLNSYQQKFNALLNSVINKYQSLLKITLNKPKITLSIIIILIGFGIYYDLKIPREFFPNDPSGSLTIQATGTPQDDIQTLLKKLNQFAPFYQASQQADYRMVDIRKNPDFAGQLQARLNIKYQAQRLHDLPEITEKVNQFIKDQHIENSSVRMNKFLNSGDDSDLDFTVTGSGSVDDLNRNIEQLTSELKKSPLFSNVSNTINQPHKQMAFNINTIAATRLGITRQAIKTQLETLFGGYQLSNNMTIGGLDVPILLQLDKSSLQNPSILEDIQITSPINHKAYALSQFVSLNIVAQPNAISTYNNQPAVDIQAGFSKKTTISQAVPFIQNFMAQHAPDLNYEFEGAAKQYLQGNKETIMIAVLGLLCVYFVLAVLFNSLLDPFIILLTVPFSVIGGAACLRLSGGTLNLFSTLALITLIGLITKHGVLIVQFASHELHRGASVKDAILTATHHRFRPIIMTTLAMTLGILPLAISQSVMYVARRDLSIVLISGLLIGTIFSLFVIPLVYTLLKRSPPMRQDITTDIDTDIK